MKNFGTVKCPPALSALTPKLICHQRPSGVPVKRRKVIFSVILASCSGGKPITSIMWIEGFEMLMLEVILCNAQCANIPLDSNKTNLFSLVNRDKLMTKESLKISFSKKFRKRRNSSMKKFPNE